MRNNFILYIFLMLGGLLSCDNMIFLNDGVNSGEVGNSNRIIYGQAEFHGSIPKSGTQELNFGDVKFEFEESPDGHFRATLLLPAVEFGCKHDGWKISINAKKPGSGLPAPERLMKVTYFTYDDDPAGCSTFGFPVATRVFQKDILYDIDCTNLKGTPLNCIEQVEGEYWIGVNIDFLKNEYYLPQIFPEPEDNIELLDVRFFFDAS